MKNDSKKAKARYLQNLVRDRIKKLFPKLGPEDIRTARKLFPYSVETKNRQEYIQIYKAFKQAKRHTILEPLLVIKRNREKPLAIIDMEHFFNLLDD